jgi:hypothetical protein
MNKKVLGIILISLGGYLTVGNTILSLLLNRVYYIHPVSISPLNYWLEWLADYGYMTILVALIGIILINEGIGITKKTIKNSNPNHADNDLSSKK